jgi:hypothetical protein
MSSAQLLDYWTCHLLLLLQMGPCLAELSVAALDPEVEPASAGEAKLLLRCVGAMLRKHVLLLPELAPKMIETLLAGCGASRLVKYCA